MFRQILFRKICRYQLINLNDVELVMGLKASIILILITSNCYAQWACEDSRTTNLTIGSGSLAQLPAMDQSKSSLCYAFTVSQLADAYRYRNPALRKGRIAPAFLGMLSEGDLSFSNLSYGNSERVAVAALNNYGHLACDEAYLKTIIGSTKDQYEYFSSIEQIFKQLEYSCAMNPVHLRSKKLAIELLRESLTSAENLRGSPVGGLQDFLSDMGAIVLDLNKVPAVAFRDYNHVFHKKLMAPVFKRLCEGKTVKVPRVHLLGISRGRAERGTGYKSYPHGIWPSQALHAAWSRLNMPEAQPLGINFCSGILATNRTISPDESREKCGPHAAVLAGTRCKNKRKQFLIRNSYGPGCGSSLTKFHRTNCDGRGNLWIDAEYLLRSSSGVYGLK